MAIHRSVGLIVLGSIAAAACALGALRLMREPKPGAVPAHHGTAGHLGPPEPSAEAGCLEPAPACAKIGSQVWLSEASALQVSIEY